MYLSHLGGYTVPNMNIEYSKDIVSSIRSDKEVIEGGVGIVPKVDDSNLIVD